MLAKWRLILLLLPMPRAESVDWYNTPLFYDIIFDEDTLTEADFLEVMHQRHGTGIKQHRSVLELACGTGRLVREMKKRGWISAGFDAGQAMLEFAGLRLRQEGIKAILWQDRMESFKVPSNRSFDLVHCLVSTFKYLPDEKSALDCLNRVSRHLKPGGVLVLGIHLSDYSNLRVSHERWVAQRNGIEVVCNTRTWPADRRARLEPIRARLRITHPDGQVRLQETKWQARTYSARQLKRLIDKVPALNLVECYDFKHDPKVTRRLDSSYEDVVLVLRRK